MAYNHLSDLYSIWAADGLIVITNCEQEESNQPKQLTVVTNLSLAWDQTHATYGEEQIQLQIWVEDGLFISVSKTWLVIHLSKGSLWPNDIQLVSSQNLSTCMSQMKSDQATRCAKYI